MTIRTKSKQMRPKIHLKSARTKCRSHLNNNLLSENVIYAPLNVFSKRMGATNIRNYDKISTETKNTNIFTKLNVFLKSCGIEVI